MRDINIGYWDVVGVRHARYEFGLRMRVVSWNGDQLEAGQWKAFAHAKSTKQKT
jgi:hypothetical protein